MLYNRYSCKAKEFETAGLETQQDERGISSFFLFFQTILHDSIYNNNHYQDWIFMDLMSHKFIQDHGYSELMYLLIGIKCQWMVNR